MNEIKNVCIGIQARSTSSRFPRKVFELIGGKPMLKHVVDACDRSAFYLNRHTHHHGAKVSYALLVPHGDEIKAAFSTRSMVLEGSEQDVLSRYVDMAKRLGADYVVRVTGDCPLVPDFLITKLIKITLANRYDYCSNVDPKVRTSIDGHDVEVFSKRALAWADEAAKEASDREHVTTLMRTSAFEDQFAVGHIMSRLDHSHVKLSVDTLDDLERVRVEYERRNRKREIAEKLVGKMHVHTV